MSKSARPIFQSIRVELGVSVTLSYGSGGKPIHFLGALARSLASLASLRSKDVCVSSRASTSAEARGLKFGVQTRILAEISIFTGDLDYLLSFMSKQTIISVINVISVGSCCRRVMKLSETDPPCVRTP